MFKFLKFLFVISLIGLFSSVPVFADYKLLDAIQEFGEKRFVQTSPSNLKVGPLKVHPRLGTQATYDDNILLEKKDAREDVVYNIRPGAILELPIDKHQLAVGYEADLERFTKPVDGKQNNSDHNFFALADLHFNSAYVNILEKLTRTSSRSGTTFTERVPRLDQTVNPKVGYRWKRMVFESGYRSTNRNYENSINDKLDFQLNEWTEVIYYDLFAKLKSFLEYQFAQIDYRKNADRNGTFNQAEIGLEGEVLPNMLVKVKAGPQFRNYKGKHEDFFSAVADAEIQYQYRKNINFKAGLSRQAVEATFLDIPFYKEHFFHAGVDYKIRPQWTLFTDARYFRHAYAERADVDGRAGFRRDNHVGAQTGVRYEFRPWWTWEASYTYLVRRSNFSAFDYTDNQFSLASNIAY